MSTRSRIGIQLESGEVKSIYCHFDGYERGVGTTLRNHYMDRAKVETLIELGDISSLGERVSPETEEELNHSINNRMEGITVAYHRDRGDSLNPPRINRSIESFSKSDIEEYGYVFNKDGNWIVFSSY